MEEFSPSYMCFAAYVNLVDPFYRLLIVSSFSIFMTLIT